MTTNAKSARALALSVLLTLLAQAPAGAQTPAGASPKPPPPAAATATVPAATAAAPAPAADVRPEIRRGTGAIRKGNFDAAMKAFEAALVKDPTSVDARLGLSWTLVKTRQYRAAAERAVDVLNANPGHPRALALLGMSLMRAGLLGEAKAAFSKALESNADEPLAIAGLSEVELYSSNFASSLKLIRRAVALNRREPDYMFLLGQAAARQESFEEAADAYEAFLTLAPKIDGDRRAKIRGLVDLYRALNGVHLYGIRGPQTVDLPFEVSDRQLPIINVTLNGKGPFRFVVDTGSGFIVISDVTAQRLNINPIARGGSSQGVGGTGSFPVVYGLIRTFGLGDTKIDNCPTYIRKFHQASDEAIDGFIGLSVISRFAAAVDYTHRTFELRSRDTSVAEPGPDDFSVPYRVTTGGMLSVPTDIGAGTRLNFIVDTGASSTVVSTEAFNAFKLGNRLDSQVKVRVTGAGGITDQVPVVVLPQLSVFGETAESSLRRELVRALVLDLGPLNETAGFAQAGIIGGNVLRHYRLELDFARGRIILRHSQPAVLSAGASSKETS